MKDSQLPRARYPFLRTLLFIGITPPVMFFLGLAALEYSGYNWFCGQGSATHPCSFSEYLFNSPNFSIGLLICAGIALTWVMAILAHLRFPRIFHRPHDPGDENVTRWKL